VHANQLLIMQFAGPSCHYWPRGFTCPHNSRSRRSSINMVKVIVSQVPYLTKHCAMKVDVWNHVFLTRALVGDEWSASRPCRFIPGERALCTHWIGCWVDSCAGLDDKKKWKFFTLPVLELRSLVVQPVVSRYTFTCYSPQVFWRMGGYVVLCAAIGHVKVEMLPNTPEIVSVFIIWLRCNEHGVHTAYSFPVQTRVPVSALFGR
jgi:hypothetical protein